MNVTLRKKSTQPSLSTPSIENNFLNENKLRDIIKEELAAALKSSFKELLTEQLRNIQGELSEFKSSFEFFNEQFEDFKKRSDEKDAVIDQLRNDNAKLQHTVNDLTIRLCNAEQYMRESNVEISGLPEDKSEDLVKTLQTIAKSTRMKNWESDLEDLWLSVELTINNSTKKIALCVIYIPPPVKLDSLQCFLDNVNNVLNNVDDVVILGDFNLGFIDWSGRSDDLHLSPSNYENSLGYSLVDFMSINGLHQFNSHLNADNRILDLVLSNMSDLTVTKPDDLLSKLDAHHPNILISISIPNVKQLETKCRSGYNFYKADYKQIKTHLKNINWYDTFRECINANDRLNVFYVMLQSVIESFVPKYTKKKSKYPPWYSDSLIAALTEKEKFRQKYRKYNNPVINLPLSYCAVAAIL
ncbi:hypothetical protein HF086_013324 [Spodoptera exigua]|uniref:Endonuclease/exonuclease/phosphatase domain-containing protein n=1 Tax=Spodoptera exigua TaxID=7107 RepID=A0A922M3G1_SPOEX|nr:hypothetical protein HF086_013324 [Spodoptera exigua]